MWDASTWDDLELFRLWFYELKKCRPMVTFAFKPTKEQGKIMKELNVSQEKLSQTYKELQEIRQKSLQNAIN